MRDVTSEQQKAQMELCLWQDYRLRYESCSKHLSQYWEQCETFLSFLKSQQCDIKLLLSRINNITVSDSDATPPQAHQESNTCWKKKKNTPLSKNEGYYEIRCLNVAL